MPDRATGVRIPLPAQGHMYEKIIANLEQIEKNPQSGRVGQQQHISVTAILAKINIDLVGEIRRLRMTTLELGKQNDRLTKITTALIIIGIILALIQVFPILLSLVK